MGNPKRAMMAGPLIAILATIVGGVASGQAPTDLPSPLPGGRSSSLGPAPGATDAATDSPGIEGFIGNRPGPATPRVPFSVVRPGAPGRPEAIGPRPLPEPPSAEIPLYGPLALPDAEDLGPESGLTLDAAVRLLIRNNLDLRARAMELPQAEADVLTAGLLPNPILFTDAQLIPYGSYDEQRPGGPPQYDLNITYPLDLSGKRRSRVRSAEQARRVREAQHRDAIRLRVDALYGAFVDSLAAREILRFARANISGLEGVLEKTEALYRQGDATKVDLNRFRIQRETGLIALGDAEEARRRADRALATLLNVPPDRADAVETRGSLRVDSAALPPVEALVNDALRCRPDVVAYRLGVALARADLDLARANRFEDVFLLYQPFTYQTNSAISPEFRDSTSWALGLTAPLPVFNRNQGNVRRAEINVAQTETELAALVRRVVDEVRDAAGEHAASLAAVRRIEAELLPAASEVVADSYRLYIRGEADAVGYLISLREYNDVVRQYFTALVRHRRGMLALNTAVGRRLLP